MTKPETAADPLWQAGWYRFAHRLVSPNAGARPAGAQVDLIVVHSISLPPGEYGGGEVQQLFTNTLDWNAHPYFKRIEGLTVSAHFFITRQGELWQFVSCDERAWHAGRSQYRGRAECNDDSIGIELEGLEGERFEAAQYEALAGLCAAIAQHYPVQHIAGHEHIAPGRKQDPGPGFDWNELRRSLAWPAQSFPA
ncbi:MAG TPA: 1,6-anhydro-N-acetylmuramyl-L-alanine amidase AmpD [Ramlibacter sp.]|nr:1,6-anhydro-N-acetylmuramyl-L-alanine amidase AmpD [Ramlibacter sp.]